MMRPANLLPADLAREGARRLPAPAMAAVGAGVAVGALLTVGYVSASNTVSSREAELASLQAQIAAVPAPKPAHTTIKPELAAEKDARQAALDQALTGRVPWDTVLRELSLVLPDDVWLQSLSAKAADPSSTTSTDPTAAPAAGSGLTMTGYTYSQEGVARLLTRLALVPQLDNVQLQSSSSATVSGRNVVTFSIGASVAATNNGSGGGS